MQTMSWTYETNSMLKNTNSLTVLLQNTSTLALSEKDGQMGEIAYILDFLCLYLVQAISQQSHSIQTIVL